MRRKDKKEVIVSNKEIDHSDKMELKNNEKY